CKGPSRIRMIRALPKQPREEVLRYLRSLERIAAEADFVVHTIVTMGVAYAMPDPPPWCYLLPWPNNVTGGYPALDFPDFGDIRGYNRFTHQLSHRVEWSLWRRNEINMLRADHGFAPVRRPSELAGLGTKIPVIYPYSSAVVPVPAEWPPNAH